MAEIQARLAASRHGEAIARGAGALAALLAGDEAEDGSAGAREQAARAAAEAPALGRLDPRYAPLAGRLEGLAAELEDVAFEARSLAEGVDHDPRALAALEERLSLLYTLERKYGDRCRRPAGAGRAARQRRSSGCAALDAERARRTTEGVAPPGGGGGVAADALSARRRQAAAALAAATEAALGELGLGGTRVEIAVGRRPAGRDEPAVEVDGDAVAFDAARRRRRRLPHRPQPGRARAAAREDRLGRRALADLAGHRGGARGRRRDADPGVRRDRRRDRGPQRRPGGADACGRWRGATRSCA